MHIKKRKKKKRINAHESRVLGTVSPSTDEEDSAPRDSRLSTVALGHSTIGSELDVPSMRRTSVRNPWTATKRLLEGINKVSRVFMLLFLALSSSSRFCIHSVLFLIKVGPQYNSIILYLLFPSVVHSFVPSFCSHFFSPLFRLEGHPTLSLRLHFTVNEINTGKNVSSTLLTYHRV